MKCQTSCYYGGFERHREGALGGRKEGRGMGERTQRKGESEREDEGDARSKRCKVQGGKWRQGQVEQ